MTASSRHPKKSHLPVAAWAIQRRGLRARLSAALDYKVTLVSAPPGYGKSTAVAEFAHSTSAPVAWHALETRERDVLNLFLHFLEAVTKVFPGIDRSAYPVGQTSEELAREATELLRHLTRDEFIYVLDDCQILTGYEGAELWLSLFVENLPKNVHLILISRSTPKLPYMQMTARKEILPIRQDHLRFNDQELGELAGHLDVDAAAIQRMAGLLDTLEGWPAGTVLALQPLPEEIEKTLPDSAAGPEALFDSLASTMLAGQAPELRNFLLASSTFNRMTPELCSRVLGYEDSSSLFEQVAKKNLFLSRAPEGMSYHKLFRIFLQRRLYEENPNLFASYHLQAGVWFEQNRDPEEAFDHFIAGNAPNRAQSIAERMAEITFKQGRYETLLRWHRKLTPSSLNIPWLRYASAMIYIDLPDYERALQELEQAEHYFIAAEDESALAKVRFQQAQIALRQARFDESISIANRLTRLPVTEDNLQGRALHILGLANLRKGDAQTAADYLEHAVPLFRAFGDSYALSWLLQDLELAYVRLGRTDEATRTLQEVVVLRRSLGSPGPLAHALNNLAYDFHRHGLYAEAMSTLQEGLDKLAGTSNPRAESYLMWTMADLLRDCRQFDQAQARYIQALEVIADAEPLLRCSLLINFAILRRWQNNPRAACQLAEEALQLAEGINAASEQHLAQTVLRAAEVDLGEDPKEALADVQRSVDALREISSLAELVPMLALLADIALIGDDEPTAYQALHDALHIADRGVGRQALLAEAVNNARFDALVKRAHIKDFVEARDRLAGAELHTTSITDTSDATPPPTYSLRVYALGKDQVERDGELVPDSVYESTRSRELFMHLLFLGPQTWEDVGLYFWKDKSAKQVRNNFQTNVHRTRTALGRNAIIHENGFYMVDPTLDIWCDVFEMEKLIRQARLLSSHTAYTEGLWQSVVDLYQGDFLPSVDSDWADLRRHELREKYFEALIELGGCLLLRDALTDAIGIFQKVLLVDPLREEAHREIMRCYGQRGEVGSVLKQYRQLEDLLAEELGAIPSEETTALMKKLTGHKNPDT